MKEMVNTQQKMTSVERTAQVISRLFHPFLLPAIAFIFLIMADPSQDLFHKFVVGSVAVLFSVILVPAYILFLKRKGLVDSADIVIREQRINPLLVGAASYFIGFLLLKGINAPSLIQGLMFCYATNTLLVVSITKWWKVSVHTTAISGPLVVLAYQFGNLAFPFFGLIPLVGASRLVLKRHTVGQVLVGAAIGVFMTALQIRLFFNR